MEANEQAIAGFRSRLAALLAVRLALRLITGWIFVWGMAVLVLRAALGTPRTPLAWGLVGIVPGVAVGILMAWRQAPGRACVRALLDKHSRCGGLFMAADDVDVGSWHSRMPAVGAPDVSWRGGRAWGLLAVAASFLIIAFLVPQRLVSLNLGHTLEIDEQVEKLAAQIEVLKEEKILEPTKAEALIQKLKQIRNEASGEDPVKTWEALDHLEAIPKQTAGEAAEEAISETEELTKAEALANALASALSKPGEDGEQAMEPQLASAAMAELAEMVKEAAEENEQLKRRLKKKELMKAIEARELTPEQLEQLAKHLSKSKGELADLLNRLNEAQLIDPRDLALIEQMGECDMEGLRAMLECDSGQCSLGEMLDGWLADQLGEGPDGDGSPGRGGINRGRGDAAMAFGDESAEEGAKFKETVLPPAALKDAKESMLAGVSMGAPTVDADAGPSEAGALTGAAAGGGSAHTQTVLPRHRGAVRRYFERE